MYLEKLGEIVGLPVICAGNGKKIGIVADVSFITKEKEVVAFLLERKGCEVKRRFILLKDVLSLGKDALIVNDSSSVSRGEIRVGSSEAEDGKDIRGIKIYSRQGQDIGTVNDILFDYRTGVIEGVIVSDGLLQDVATGRNILPLIGKVEFGEENILVDSDAVEEMINTGGGIRKYIK